MDDTQDQPSEAKKGGMLKMLLLGGGAALLLGAGIAAGPVIQNMLASPDETAADGEGADAADVGVGPELYQGLHPALVVNFRDELGEPHFMQIEMEVMARDQETINAVREHTPLIRNNLILLYGNVKYEEISTREGKEQMLADGLAEIREIMAKRIDTPNVEAVYFTSLIIQ